MEADFKKNEGSSFLTRSEEWRPPGFFQFNIIIYMRCRGVFHSNPWRKRNEWSSAKTGHCLNGLGIVEKEQGLATGCQLHGSLKCHLRYCYSISLLFFYYEALSMSLRGFRGRLFMERLAQRNSPVPQITQVSKKGGCPILPSRGNLYTLWGPYWTACS